MGPMSDEERDFLRDVAWSEGAGWLTGSASVIAEVEGAAAELLDRLRELHPNRAKRLLLTRIVAARLQQEADELLRDLIAGEFHWTEVGPGDWRSAGIQDHEKRWLAAASGRHPSTIGRLVKQIVAETLDAAIQHRNTTAT